MASHEGSLDTVPECITSSHSRQLFANIAAEIQATLAAVSECIASPQSREPGVELETRIQNASRRLADLRRQQNTLLPVSRLPDDILFQVFSILVHHADMSRDFRIVYRASKVCSRWRAVASAPSLWTHVPTDKHKQAEAFLSYSGDAPIQLTVGSFTPAAMQDILAPHRERIELLRIYDVAITPDPRWWIPWLAAPCPRLRSLRLVLMDAAWSPVKEGWPFRKEDRDFGANLTALRSLTLRGFHLPPGAPIFRNLRHLHLSRQPALLLNSTVVARIVRDAPQLEALELEQVGRDDTEKGIERTACSVALPRLRTLTMHGVPPRFAENLLVSLTLPPTARIGVRIWTSDRSQAGPLPRLTAGLARVCLGARALECIIGFSSYSRHSVTYLLRRDATAPEPDFLLALDEPDPYQTAHAAVFSEGTSIDGSGLERYTLRYVRCTDPNAPETRRWPALLAQMSALRVLTVVESPEGHLIELLDALSDTGSWRAPLEEIRLRGVACTEAFWRTLRAVARTRQPALRVIEVSKASGMTDVAHDMAREVERLMESFELSAE